MTQRNYAALLAARGFPVFHLLPDRTPFRKRYWEHATTDPSPHEFNGGNIGVATGVTLIVIDIDVKQGACGHESLAVLEAFSLPRATFTVRTTSENESGNPGLHLYYRVPAGYWRSRVGWFPGIDVRGDHGYVVGPGSEKNGRLYTVELDLPAADLPEAFHASLRGKPKSSALAIVPKWADNDAAIAAAVTYLVDEAPALTVGERDAGLIVIANRVMDLGISPDKANELIAEYWLDDKCSPPVPPEDLLEKVTNAAKSRHDPIGWKPPRPPAEECFEIEVDISTSTESRLNRFVWGAELELQALKPDRPLVRDIIEQGTVSLWYGDSNSGKSFSLLSMFDAIAAGGPWAGRETRQGAVCYFAGEGGRGLVQRALALRKAYERGSNHPLFLFPVAGEVLGARGDVERMIADVKAAELACGARCVAIAVDTLARAFLGDENAAADMGRFIRCIDLVRKATGAHVAIVHHSGKDPGKGARGSTALRGAVDSEFLVMASSVASGAGSAGGATGSIRNTKQRDMETAPRLQFKLKRVPIGEVEGVPLVSAIAEVEVGIVQELKPLTELMRQYLDALAPGIWVTSAEWRLMADETPDLVAAPDTHRKRQARLVEGGYIERREDDVGEPEFRLSDW